MNRQTYLEQRNTLLTEAENALTEGNLTLSQEKREAVKALDENYKAFCDAQAELEAEAKKQAEMLAEQERLKAEAEAQAKLTKPVVTPIEDKSVKIETGKVVDNLDVKIKDKELEAFGNFLAGKSYDESALRFTDSANTRAGNTVVIPETYKKQIWQEMADRHPILADLAMTFVNGNLTIRKEVAKGDAAAWYDETGAIADGALSFAKVELKGYELAKSVPITWALKKMSIEELVPYILSLVAERMGAALANAVVNGLGVPGVGDTFKSQPKGIVTAIEAESNTPQEVTYNSAISYGDLTAIMGAIKSGYIRGTKIYAKNKTIWSKLANVLDGENRPIFIPDCTQGGVGRIFGIPVLEEDAIADDCVLFANVSEGYVANANEDITIYVDDKIMDRTTYYMGYAIIDGQPITTKAFAYLKKAQ